LGKKQMAKKISNNFNSINVQEATDLEKMGGC
jgi:hypothetical protein